ncbi:hypothetical protein GH714_036416 [Hevea brasiliensis]|uniref:Peptidase metallopeptidase domain-containing protein n=1 Tax=Hevea brasiliensis TaxID=3981 RepID=A0A6A6LQX6_HEVBR|nr:hypothetical protein GH714_036416 [Hevea brasiliensis]
MRLQLFAIAGLLLLLLPPITARFFPNVSSIPPGFVPNATAPAWDSFKKFAGCRAGENFDGLSKLKQYFHYFGYIPNSPSNFTDDFDDAFESALKTYQQNFNLNVTGELDQQTLNKLVQPRCGNADIVNGTTTMNSGKWTAFNSTSLFHTVGHYTFFPGNPHWPDSKRDLTYSFFPGNELTEEEKSVFARAFDRWSTVIPMTFTQTDSFTTADIRIGFFSGDHGDGEPFDGFWGLWPTLFPAKRAAHLDLDENWVDSGDVSTSPILSAVDLESVAVHEIGHLLGLGHSSVEEAIMYPSIPSRTRKVELAQDDIDGIQQLYGKNPNYNGTSTSSIQERETSGADYVHSRWSLISFLMRVGFLLLLL